MTDDKTAYLRQQGWTVGDRDPRLNTKFPGRFMCVEEHEESELPTEDGSNGPWCIVGDDLEDLVRRAYDFVIDLEDLEHRLRNGQL